MAGEGRLSDERLAEIRQQVDEYARKVYKKSDVEFGYGLHELLAEIDRLREELAIVGKNLDEERGYYDDDSERSDGDGG